MLSPAKPALQSDEGSKKTPLAAVREAWRGCNPCGTRMCSQLENPELSHVSLPSFSTLVTSCKEGPWELCRGP